MTTNELDGRALAEAAARAMGWQDWHYGPPGWFDPNDGMRNYGEPCFAWVEPMMAWLRERGEVEAYSNAKGASATLWYPDIDDGAGGCKVGGTSPTMHGSTILEALQRLVVAVAAREQAAKGEP